MKTNQLLKCAIAIGALWSIFGALRSQATPAVWTNNSATNAWETAGNWDINQVPNNNTFDVTIGIAAACNFSSAFQINSLNLSVNTANLNLSPGATLAFTSNVTNNGTILVNTTGANAGTFLRFDATGQLGGTGSVRLNGVNFNEGDIYANNGANITHGVGHLIRGRGDINTRDNGSVFVNNGTIDGDDTTGALRVYLSNAAGNQNNATMKATGGGSLALLQGVLDQTGGGAILADGANSVVQFSNTIIGGTTNTANGGVLLGVSPVWQNVTNSGTVRIPAGQIISLTGNGLTNNGTILVNSTDPLSNTAYLRPDSAGVLLDGNGTVTLDGIGFNTAAVYLQFGRSLVHGANHTIVGRGDIQGFNGGTMTNNGTINANVAGDVNRLALIFDNGTNNENNGTMKATNGALLSVSGKLTQGVGGMFLADGPGSVVQLSATIIGGTLETANGGVVKGVNPVLTGVTNNGDVQIPGNNNIIVNGTGLTNNGTILVNSTDPISQSGILRFDESGALGGTGDVMLNGSGFSTAILICNNVNVTNGHDHTIGGTGDLFIDGGSALLINKGAIAPGASAGLLRFRGTLNLRLTSNLAFEVGGTGQGTTYDLLTKTDSGALKLNGNLTVDLINAFSPAPGDTFTILATQTPLTGQFNNVLNGGRLNTEDGNGSFLVTYSGNNVVLSDFGAPIPSSQLQNISTRASVMTGQGVTIAGFIITGTDSKKVIIRGLGPSLQTSGISNFLVDPTLELHAGSGALITSNDDWKENEAEVNSTGLPPGNDAESAIVATLAPGAYTAILKGDSGGTGIGLVEVYDIDPAGSKLANISTRGFVGTSNQVMIGGTIIGPGSGESRHVLVRVLGPSLAAAGIASPLLNPTLELRDASGAIIASNDQWKSDQQTDIEDTGLAPGNDDEAAILRTVNPGNYTAIVRGAGGTTGIALVEIYDLGGNSCVPAPANLVSWWPGDGNADDIQSGNDGTLEGNTTFAAGKVDSAFSFDGDGDRILIGNPAALQVQNFTIEAWIKRGSSTVVSNDLHPTFPNGTFFAYGAGGYGFFIDQNTQTLGLTKVGTSNVVSATLPITDTNYHHVAVTKSGNQVIFYVDGVASTPAAYDPGFTFTTDAAIAARGDGDLLNAFFGDIDELEIFDRALTSTEIGSIYAAASNGKCKP